jgi:hypothetical protein
MRLRPGLSVVTFALLVAVCVPLNTLAREKKPKKSKELPPVEHHDYKVEGGMIKQVTRRTPVDSTKVEIIAIRDTITGDTLRMDTLRGTAIAAPAAVPVAAATLAPGIAAAPQDTLTVSKREQRRLDRLVEEADTSFVRYSPIFRDTLPLSRMTAISLVVPGFSQLHNQQYWKIPIAWASLGGMIAGYAWENRAYQPWRTQYDDLVAHNATRAELDPVQRQMIMYNTRRQLFMAGIYISWVYFICDGAINYPGTTSTVKKATTLSTILPGAGQIYNRSYWKVPFVLGGFATMGMVIDWNNRGYQRFSRAYKYVTDGDDSTVDEFGGRYSADFLNNLKKSYRRNRDMAIILTGALYLLNIIDAHVDSQLKTYDISDDLSYNFEPSMTTFYSMRSSKVNMPGFTFSISF